MPVPEPITNTQPTAKILGAIERHLKHCTTYGSLHFRAYTMVMSWVDEMQMGTIVPTELMRCCALLKEVMSNELARIQATSALGTPPAPGTRRSAPER